MNLRLASLACLFVAPLIAVPLVTRIFVDRAAPELASIVTSSLDRLFAWRDVHTPEDTLLPALPETAPPSDDNTANEISIASPRSSQLGSPRHRGIVVRADAVVRAVQSGGRPSSTLAPAVGERPAGLSLVGVSRFGTGLHDGDILTSVGGTAATSEAIVIGIVASAIGQGAKAITGVVWRGDQRIDVAVQIPAPEAFDKRRRRGPSVHK